MSRILKDNIPNAQNFKYYEFVKSYNAIRYGINNIPTDIQWENIERLAANVIQPIRNKFGRIRISSGYRNPKLNVLSGGSPTSNHCRGEAADIEPLEDGVKLIDILNFINFKLPFRELIAEFFPEGWVHVAYRENGNAKILKLKDSNHNFKRVTIDYINKIYG